MSQISLDCSNPMRITLDRRVPPELLERPRLAGAEGPACQAERRGHARVGIPPFCLLVPAWASKQAGQGRHSACAGMLLLRPDATPRWNGLWPNRLVRGKAPSLGLGKQPQFGFWIGKLFFRRVRYFAHNCHCSNSIDQMSLI